MSKISVIIPCYNASPWICETIQSVLRQNYTPLEIILVDDGSHDGSADLVESMFPMVKVVRISNQGVSHARNVGTALATGDFIKYLDADDLVAPGNVFQKQVNILESSNADVVYGDWQMYEIDHDVWMPHKNIMTHIAPPNPEPWFLKNDFPIAVHCCLYKSRVTKSIKWVESLHIAEDIRFQGDCAGSGFTFIYEPGLVAIYRRHSNSLTTGSLHRVESEKMKNALQLMDKWTSEGHLTIERRDALLYVLFQVAYNFASTLFDWRQAKIALEAIEALDPNHIPPYGNQKLVAMARRIGLRNALWLGMNYHKVRNGIGKRDYIQISK